MNKGILWAIVVILALGVILFTLANKDEVERGASEVTDSAERVIENVEAELDEEFDDESEPGDAFEGDDEVSADSGTEADADEPLVAEEDPSFQADVDVDVN